MTNRVEERILSTRIPSRTEEISLYIFHFKLIFIQFTPIDKCFCGIIAPESIKLTIFALSVIYNEYYAYMAYIQIN